MCKNTCATSETDSNKALVVAVLPPQRIAQQPQHTPLGVLRLLRTLLGVGRVSKFHYYWESWVLSKIA